MDCLKWAVNPVEGVGNMNQKHIDIMLSIMEESGIEPIDVINWIADMPEFQTSDDWDWFRKLLEKMKLELAQ